MLEERPSAHWRGHDKRWRRIRNAVLAAEPLCRHCADAGRVTAIIELGMPAGQQSNFPGPYTQKFWRIKSECVYRHMCFLVLL